MIKMDQRKLIQKLNELRSLPAETETVEFKEARNNFNFDDLGKYFSALCNEANLKGAEEAWLVFGVEDKSRAIVGTNYRKLNRAHLDALKNEIASHTTGRISFVEIHEVNLAEGRVVMFQIPAALKGIPVAWKGHYFGREAESISPLNLEELERIRRQRTSVDWSAEICKSATISDLEPAAISKARENFKTKNPKLVEEIDRWDDITFLNKARLTIGGKITNTAIILLGKPESEHFISPATAHITWILKDKENIEKDYEHFSCPFLLTVDQVFAKIRNLKYRFIPEEGTLFPQEVDQYEPFSIRETLNNCIVHQDYSLGGRINLVESEDSWLIFSNHGDFLPGSIENVIKSNEPFSQYRNEFLARAMVNLNLIDTVGSGIRRMFQLQRKRFFPMPDYDFSDKKVRATITGKVIDLDYSKILARNPDLSLEEIILLDKVQKRKELTEGEVQILKAKGLIEGRKPNFHFSVRLAELTDQKAEYIKNKGLSDKYYKDLILEFLKKYNSGKRSDFQKLLLNKLSDVLSEKQKQDKIKNLLQTLKLEGKILPKGKNWELK
ncbi:MAG: RNA-binding domain-containing protein [Clostridiales bacterium]